MSKARVQNFFVSLDGFATGVGPTFESPFGHAGHKLHQPFFATRRFSEMIGKPGGSEGIDHTFASTWDNNIGAEIMGRGKFDYRSGPWDEEWEGWWGDEPPFHTPVFVLTHHARPTLVKGETTFHFIDATPAEALEQARAAAGGKDVRIGGGPTMVREFLEADLVDHMHIVQVPIFLGRGTCPWEGLEGLEDRFHIEAASSPTGVVHMTFERNRE